MQPNNIQPVQVQPIQKERVGLAVASLTLGIVALLLSLPFVLFYAFPPQYPSGTEEGLGAAVLVTIGFLFALFILVPSIVLSAIFGIIAVTKSLAKARTLGSVALGIVGLAFIALIFLVVKVLLPFWLRT